MFPAFSCGLMKECNRNCRDDSSGREAAAGRGDQKHLRLAWKKTMVGAELKGFEPEWHIQLCSFTPSLVVSQTSCKVRHPPLARA